jgi:hypothetical protein
MEKPLEYQSPLHPIGSVLVWRGYRCQVVSEYWNGKVDVQFDDESGRLLTLRQQSKAKRIDVNAPPLQANPDPDVLTSEITGGWKVTVIAYQPEKAQTTES